MTPDLTNLFTDSATIALFAGIIAYLIPLGLRQWINVPPIPVALATATLVFLGGNYLSPETQSTLITFFGILFSTLAAMGISLSVNKVMARREDSFAAASGEPTIQADRWYDTF